jgi:hypothetical protein
VRRMSASAYPCCDTATGRPRGRGAVAAGDRYSKVPRLSRTYILARGAKVARRRRASGGRRSAGGALRALLAGALCAALVGGCGSSGPSAKSLLRSTLSADRSVRSGRIDLSMELNSAGNSALGGPLGVALEGPFENTPAGSLPRFALAVTLSTEGASIPLGATSTGSAFYLKLGGQYYELPRASLAALRSAYASAAGAGSGAALSPFGIEPLQWLSAPEVVGTETLEGVPVTHIRAELNVDRLIESIARISSLSSSLRTLAGGHLPALAALLEAISSQAGRSALAHALKSSQVNLQIGSRDHILRGLSLTVKLEAGSGESAALAGLSKATLSVHLRLKQVNEHQLISAPRSAQPLSELLGALAHSGLSG